MTHCSRTKELIVTQYFARMSAIYALLLFALMGCDANMNSGSSEPATNTAINLPTVTVYKSPTCGCCTLWVEHMQAHQFPVEVVEQSNVMPLKERLGIPYGMGSCHTATVGEYVIEGHVPAAEVIRLLELKPKAKGLAVPGMPIGSPGMEQGGRQDPYTVWLFFDDAPPQAFATYPKKAVDKAA